jgi:hypothetical protein
MEKASYGIREKLEEHTHLIIPEDSNFIFKDVELENGNEEVFNDIINLYGYYSIEDLTVSLVDNLEEYDGFIKYYYPDLSMEERSNILLEHIYTLQAVSHYFTKLFDIAVVESTTATYLDMPYICYVEKLDFIKKYNVFRFYIVY